jgi:hypothetical protein
MSPRIVEFRQFALERGVDPLGYCEPGLHNPMGFIPKAAQSRHLKRLSSNISDHSERLAAARAEYERLVEAGELRPMTSRERLERTAAGPDDSQTTQAARRVLARLDARSQEPRP